MSAPRAGEERGSPPPLELAWSPALQPFLLDPSAWHERLAPYARATQLAVALVDRDGRLLGACLNPRPTWRLLHAQIPPDAGACPFCQRLCKTPHL
jgi:hypothetical protein